MDSRYCVDPAWSRIGVQVQHPRFELFQFDDEKRVYEDRL